MIDVVLGVLYKDGTMLMEWRKGAPYTDAGQWVFPGGKVEPTDLTPHATLIREMKEEVGVDIKRTHLLKPVQSTLGEYLLYPALITDWLGDTNYKTNRGDRLAWRPIKDVVKTDDVVIVGIVRDVLRVLADVSTHP